LKRHGLYDNSIVVLTSDHGEMLGEVGRWGHAYYLFPQILQVPLLLHLPRGVAREAVQDTDAISFLTDITPTVYAALGYHPRAANGLMGEPLIGAGRVASALRRRGDYVAAASYSAVYAVVRRNGRRVYIIDAIKGDEYAYDRNPAGAWRRVDVSERIRSVGQRLIREHLDAVRRVYRVPDKADAGTMQAAGQ
jgi:arylsulfatase A-like enzyme